MEEKELENQKENNPVQEEDNIVQRFTNEEGKFNLAEALITQDTVLKNVCKRMMALEEAMMFFSNWYNKTQEVNILVPEHLKNSSNGIITSIKD